jgi:RNA polymerase sigma-70 factor, ECF subfamily
VRLALVRMRREPSLVTDPWSDEDERVLAVRAKTDRAAFAVLYDRYVGRVYGYCYRRLQTPEEAEDATSLIFTRALTALPRYREDGPSFGAWLFTIARNVVIDEVRTYRTRATGQIRSVDEETGLVDHTAAPEAETLVAEDVRQLRAYLTQLPPDQAHLIELRLAGLTDKEIAYVLGRSHGAIRVAQHRAIRRLRALFGCESRESV